MSEALSYRAEAAAEYDRAFSHVSSHFLPYVLRAARMAPGQRVLDVATGTGISAKEALEVVGPTGSVVATDISPEMVEKARQRLAGAPNAIVAIGDGQALTFPDATFDAVTCSLGLMFFPDPAQGLASFHSVLRPGGRAAFVLPSFNAWYSPFERGGASTGQLLASLPEATRHAVREEMRRSVNDTGGPVSIEVEHRIASGRRKSHSITSSARARPHLRFT